MRVATAPLFGGGTVAVIVDPAPLLRSKADREAMDRAIGNVAPGNALVFIEQGDAGTRRPAALQGLETAVLKAGGDAKAFKAPREGQLAGMDRGPGERAQHDARAGRGEGARPAGRRVRARGRRRPAAPGRARRGRAREARPLPAVRPGHRGRRPLAGRRGRAGLHLGVPRRRRRAQAPRSPVPSSTASSRRRPSPWSSSSCTAGSASCSRSPTTWRPARRRAASSGRWA